MYRIAVEDYRTKGIGLVSNKGNIAEYANIEDATKAYQAVRTRLKPGCQDA